MAFYPPALPLPGARAHGEGWRITCPSCEEAGPSLPGGSCTHCGARLPISSLPTTLDRTPPAARRALAILRPFGQRLATWWRRSPWFFLFFWGGLLLGNHPLSAGMVALCLWGLLVDNLFTPAGREPGPLKRLRTPADPDAALPPGAAPRPRISELHSTRIEVSGSWWQVNRIRERRGLSVHLDLRLRGFQGLPLDLELRFLGPDDRYLQGPLPNYRGPDREARAHHRTRPLRLDDSRFPDLWVYIPLRALGLPQGLVLLELTAEVRISVRGELLLRHLLPVDLVPSEEDLWAHELTSRLRPSEGLLIEAVEEAGDAACGVCGDEVEGDIQRCPVCAAAHHPECFAYLDGCSRFGCPESPGRRQAAGKG